VLLDKKDLLRDQLRALLTVSGEYPGRIRILVPMISWVEEMIEIREEVELMKQILKKEKTVVDEYIQVGAMVEVPSMVVQADKFANYSDFFSVGTNDLTQYTLAVDRGNTLISHLYQQIHPAVFRAVAYAVRAANSRQMSISVCGEAASNPMAAMAFVGLGIHNLSMTPNEIPTVKSKLRSVTYQECKSFASQLLNASTMNDVREIIARFE
jgi:phosphotransferase system enzyme I (PtsI)